MDKSLIFISFFLVGVVSVSGCGIIRDTSMYYEDTKAKIIETKDNVAGKLSSGLNVNLGGGAKHNCGANLICIEDDIKARNKEINEVECKNEFGQGYSLAPGYLAYCIGVKGGQEQVTLFLFCCAESCSKERSIAISTFEDLERVRQSFDTLRCIDKD